MPSAAKPRAAAADTTADLGTGRLRNDRPHRRRPSARAGSCKDYKSGKHAHSAIEIEKETASFRSALHARPPHLVGLEPLGGVYRPLAGARKPRGLLREAEGLEGFYKNDYYDEDGVLERRRQTPRRRRASWPGGSAPAT